MVVMELTDDDWPQGGGPAGHGLLPYRDGVIDEFGVVSDRLHLSNPELLPCRGRIEELRRHKRAQGNETCQQGDKPGHGGTEVKSTSSG